MYIRLKFASVAGPGFSWFAEFIIVQFIRPKDFRGLGILLIDIVA